MAKRAQSLLLELDGAETEVGRFDRNNTDSGSMYLNLEKECIVACAL